ncbi:MAG: hypothetical protein WCR21_11035 [Bacteroidota bacterium]
MKKKEIIADLEIYLDPKPLTKEEELGLSLFIRKLKIKAAERPKAGKQKRAKVVQLKS